MFHSLTFANRIYIAPKAMTLLEVLLAMIIFGIGIMSVMSALSWTIGSLQQSKTQTQATLLAKEGLDLMIFYKNKNLEQGLPRNCVMSSAASNSDCDQTLLDQEETAIYAISYIGTNDFRLIKNGNTQLWEGDTRYIQDTGQKKTPFQRRIIVKALQGRSNQTHLIVQVTSEVSYTLGTKIYTVALDTILGKTQ